MKKIVMILRWQHPIKDKQITSLGNHQNAEGLNHKKDSMEEVYGTDDAVWQKSHMPLVQEESSVPAAQDVIKQ
eukprot:15070231-Ditylum_brightwellii.AAC.1